MDHFTLSTTVASFPPLPYEAIKNDILGRTYQLSLALIGEVKARSINQTSRGKDYVPNVLSFPLTKSSGEIYLTPQVAKKEAKKFGHTYKSHMGFLYIHGLLHLKGLKHGPKMERLEARFMERYKLS